MFKQGEVHRFALPNVWIFAPLTTKDTLIEWEPGNTYVYRATLRSAQETIVPLIVDWGCAGVEAAPGQ